MTSTSRAKRLPVEFQRDLVDLAILHLQLGGTWDGKDLGGDTHQLSEFARQYVIDLLGQLLDGKRPYLPRSEPRPRQSADERYVMLINKAISAGAATMEEAYRAAAGASKSLADGKHDARLREAKRAWQRYWQERSQTLGPGHQLRYVPPGEMRNWMADAQEDASTKVPRKK